jgi:UDP-N-acetylmuramoyl-L-alanyl-D-glutamate--2,6-diaminopimelate ligase
VALVSAVEPSHSWQDGAYPFSTRVNLGNDCRRHRHQRKTSVADFTRQIFAALGRQAGVAGDIASSSRTAACTARSPRRIRIALHRTLAELAAEALLTLPSKASSHGLDQHRLDGVRIQAAAFTNLARPSRQSPEHGVLSRRQAAPVRRAAAADGTAVVNADVAEAERVIAAAKSAAPPS